MPLGKIIWVDDDNDLIRPQRRGLQDDGYRVQVIPDVDHAITIISEEKDGIGGIILDVMMNPGTELRNTPHLGGLLTGLRLFELLRDRGLCPPIKTFFFTHRLDPDAADSLATYGVSYHQKQHHKGKAICALVRREFGEP